MANLACVSREMSARHLVNRALAVLRRNDTGLFRQAGPARLPVPVELDSAFVALGLARVDAARGRQEVRSLLRGQWADGMVPPSSSTRSPWTTRRDRAVGLGRLPGAPGVATSGITQPPYWPALFERCTKLLRPQLLEEVVPAIEAWHDWLHRERDLDRSGMVAILHPWESADNAPRFDRASNASSSRRCRPSHAAIAATCSLRSGLPTATTRATSRSFGGSAAAGTGPRHWRMLRSRTPISASTRCWLPRRKTWPGSGRSSARMVPAPGPTLLG